MQRFYKTLLETGRVERKESKSKPEGLAPKTVRNIHQILEYWEEVERGWAFEKAVDNWYKAKESEVRHTTLRTYGITMHRLKKEFGKEHVTEIMPDEIGAYIRRFERQGYSQDTVQLKISVLKMIFDYAIGRRSESGLIVNPAAAVKKS